MISRFSGAVKVTARAITDLSRAVPGLGANGSLAQTTNLGAELGQAAPPTTNAQSDPEWLLLTRASDYRDAGGRRLELDLLGDV
jgi:hypothetical protein